MERLLIMAEKRNAAEDIAKALNLKNVGKTETGFIKGKMEGEDCVICWSNGHCLELLEPKEINPKYERWSEENLPIPFDDKKLTVIKDEKGLKKKLVSGIEKEIENATTIINAGDAGREGELIQRWILDYALKGTQKPVYRLWAQSLTSNAIAKAYNNLLGINDMQVKKLNDLYDSGRARAIMDKYLGYNYSRLVSLTQTDGVTVNYGRCKTPLTRAIIERDLEIENFKAEEFSYITIDIKKDNLCCNATLVDDSKKRITFKDEAAAEETYKSIGTSVKVSDLKKENKITTPSLLYDILSLQKEMAQKYEYEADKTLAICQALYDQHHMVSYPRTDSRYLTSDLKPEMQDSLQVLKFGKFKEYVEKAEGSFIPDKYYNDKKVADHHALIPVVPDESMEEKYNKLTVDEKNVFDAIAKSFICLWLSNYEYESIEAILKDNDNTFLLKGKKETKLGWKEVYKDTKSDDEENESEDNSDQPIMQLNVGESIKIDSKEIKNDKTKPKRRFTTATLLDFMKINNIGTGATRDTIIKELTEKKGKNKDSSVKKDGKYYVSTQFGRELDSTVPEELKTIAFLKSLEEDIEKIANGKLNIEDFLKKIDADFKEKKSYMTSHRRVVLKSEVPKQELTKFICKDCGSPLIDKKWGYTCSGWKKDGSGCNFSISKDYFGTKISDVAIKQLLTAGKTTNKLKIKKKAGGTYEAYLEFICEDGKWKLKPSFD